MVSNIHGSWPACQDLESIGQSLHDEHAANHPPSVQACAHPQNNVDSLNQDDRSCAQQSCLLPRRQYIQPVPAAKKRSFLPMLLLLTDLAWIATYLVSMGLNDWSFQNLKLNPMAGSTAEVLTTLGAVDYDKVVNGHQWWRIVAAPFLCSGQCSAGDRSLMMVTHRHVEYVYKHVYYYMYETFI